MIKIENIDPSFLNTDTILYKSTDAVIYDIRYITMKSLDLVNIDSKNW